MHYLKVLEIKPDLEVHVNLGDALVACEKPKEALDHYQKALDFALARNDKTLIEMIQNRISRLRP